VGLPSTISPPLEGDFLHITRALVRLFGDSVGLCLPTRGVRGQLFLLDCILGRKDILHDILVSHIVHPDRRVEYPREHALAVLCVSYYLGSILCFVFPVRGIAVACIPSEICARRRSARSRLKRIVRGCWRRRRRLDGR